MGILSRKGLDILIRVILNEDDPPFRRGGRGGRGSLPPSIREEAGEVYGE